ncbi:MAG: SIS domain-containing protein [Candidatus Humimicrobiaceae bacterium]
MINKKSINKDVIFAEIKSQSQVWLSVINDFQKKKDELISIFEDHGNIYLIGSGSSYHTGLITEFVYRDISDKNLICVPSSEFLFFHDNYLKNRSSKDIFILISRTGGTSDTLMAGDIIKEIGGYSVCLTTFPDTELSKKSDYPIILKQCQESSITSTRAVSGFTTFILSLFFTLNGRTDLVELLSKKSGIFFKRFHHHSNMIKSIIEKNDIKKYIFLGHGPFYGIAREAALKVKEMSLVNTEFWRTLEYRHGHNTILDSSSMIILFLSKNGSSYELKTCKELRKIGAKVLVIYDSDVMVETGGACDWQINIGLRSEELLQTVFFQIFGQLIGYHQAVKKNINPSSPRNLDYVVKI